MMKDEVKRTGGPNGEGFFETANNLRLEMQTRFTF
jgi:hypothetical protein